MHDILLPQRKLTRLRNTFRHPRQASLAARIPMAGRRVPLRGFWRRRSMRGMAPAERYLDRSSHVGSAAVLLASRSVDADSRLGRKLRSLDRRQLGVTLAAASAGALAMYYLDRHQGRRRRALLGDRATHLAHRLRLLPRSAERKRRFARGRLRGVEHAAAELAGMTADGGVPDDETLVARVRSEAIRHTNLKAGQINIDAYEGCVTLRGQLERSDEINALIDATKHIDGVREVRSYLHLQGTLPPNKAESYTHVPDEMRAR